MDTAALQSIQSVFELVEREIWIITATDGQRPGGLVATWVSQASIDQQSPVLAIAIAKNHHTRELIDQSNAFAVHLISAEQVDIAWRFAIGSGRDRDKFAGLSYTSGTTSSPLLPECLACLEARVITQYDGGDRIYYWAEVVAGQKFSDESPLTDHQLFGLATEEQKSQMRAGMLADIEVQRPMSQAWREANVGR